MTNSWVSALFFATMGALTYWVWLLIDENLGQITPARLHEPDYYMEHMKRNTLDETGTLKNVLFADLATHYPDDDTTELESPRMEIYNGNLDPWYVIGETGWVSSGSEIIVLHGEVEIWRLNSQGQRDFEVLTSELRVLPKEQYAETAEPATIMSKTTVTNTIGMRANFAHDRLEFLEEVKSRHEINPSS